MPHDFSYFEQGIDRVAQRRPDLPRNHVVLNRLFFFVFRELDDVYSRHLAQFGLSNASLLALAILYGSEDNRINPCELSDALIASRTNVTRLTDELVNSGWVERQPSTEDRRKVELSLTASGREMAEKVLPTVWRLASSQWADFSEQEQVDFDRLLRKMLNGLNRLKDSP